MYTIFNMVSKAEYWRRKEAGLCVKCGKDREGSPSAVRCIDCHNKISKSQAEKRAEETAAEVAQNLKTNSVLNTTENIKVCQKCGETPLSFNLICQKCLGSTHFTKEDAIKRYSNCCSTCGSTAIEKLKIVSSDISKAIKYKTQQEMFRLVCYRRIPPPDLRVMCHICYWKENLAYVLHLREIFDNHGIFEENIDNDDMEDVIDI